MATVWEVAVFRVKRFCVQTFERRQGQIRPAVALEFMYEKDARNLFAIRRKACDGISLYSVEGEPMSGLWARPVLLEADGATLSLDA